jgi:hypothetical protein
MDDGFIVDDTHGGDAQRTVTPPNRVLKIAFVAAFIVAK